MEAITNGNGKRPTFEEALKEHHMSPNGSLRGVTPLLDQKRWQYGIPDLVFKCQPAFNKVYVAQIPEDRDTWDEAGLIIKTEETKHRERYQAARGVIISAGLMALDGLRSNGLDLGHTVAFVRQAPFRRHCGTILGKRVSLVVLHAGDICDSEDLAESILGGECRFVSKPNEEGALIHSFVDSNGKAWVPVQPEILEDS